MAEYKISRLKFTWKGDWQPSLNYIVDDVVRFGGKSYVCIKRHISSTQSFYADLNFINQETIPASDEPRWELMFDGYEWRGDWTPFTTYNVGDIVKYKSISYVCISSHTSNTETIGLEGDQSHWVSYARSDDWKGDWQPSTIYSVRDVVKYNGIVYRCTARNISSDVTTGLEGNFADWEIVNPAQQWRQAWTTNRRYRKNDIVKYGGIVYRCIDGHTSALTASDGLESNQADWEIVYKNIEYKGNWVPAVIAPPAPGVRYKLNDVVKFGGSVWICVDYHTSTDDFDPTKWQVYIPGFEFENDWDSNTVYQRGDVVRYGGYSYEALNNNTGQNPATSAAQNDDSSIAFWKLLNIGFRVAGEWINNTAYFVGEVVRRNGQFYAAIDDNITDPNIDATAWELVIPGEKYRKEWEIDETYAIGDIVVFEDNTYRCLVKHLASNINQRPDNDYDNNLWTLLIRGEPTNSLRYQGDIKVYDETEDGSTIGQSRLPIGIAGQTLRVVDNSPSWETFGQIQKVYYVSREGVDLPDNGTSLNSAFRTVRYACNFAVGPATIFVKAGVYSEILPIKVPRDVAIVGEELRSTIIEPLYDPNNISYDVDGDPYPDPLDYRLSDMFYVNNGSGIRNMTLRGLNGTLSSINQYGTRRPTAGAYVSLDPGTGTADSSVWITTKSCYVQNVTTFGNGCVGLKVDGALHGGGNKSIVANDFTQILSDGIGAWVTNNGLSELVSVFSYYGHMGYLAENGGKIRATNGNSSYGTYGCVAEGVDETETPAEGSINNRTGEAIVVSAFSGEANDEILNLEFSNAGENYTSATMSFLGSGAGASVIVDEFRDGGIFEWRLLDPEEGGFLGGGGFQSTGNNAQGGDTTGITIASNDERFPADYIGARIIITSGTGTGQYGTIGSYDIVTKRIDVYNEYNGELGWTHVIAGYPLPALLDTTSVYRIEPRVITAPPAYSADSSPYDRRYFLDAIYIKEIDRFVAAGRPADGSVGAIYIGNDETNLSVASSANNTQLYTSVAWDGSRIAAVTNQTSTMVATWNSGSFTFSVDDVGTALGFSNCTNIAGGNGTFVATAPTLTTSVIVYTSSWTLRSTPISAPWRAVAHGKNKFVIISTDGKTAVSTNSGVTWTAGSDIPAFGDSTQPQWTDMCYGNNRFVAISSNSNAVAYSFDGLTWYLSVMPFDTAWRRISYDQGLFVAISSSSTQYAAVSDSGGFSWELKQLDSGSLNRHALAFVPDTADRGRWVLLSEDSGTVDTFQYGATFRGRPVITGGRIQSMKIWEPGSGYNAQPVFTLSDPVSTSNPEYEFRIGNGVLANPTFLNRGIGYKTSTTRVTVSGDGYADVYELGGDIIVDGVPRIVRTGANFEINTINWLPSVLPISGPWGGVTAGTDKFVGITYQSGAGLSQIVYSANGEGWTSTTISQQRDWRDIKFGNGVYIAVAYGTVFARSTNGISWTTITVPNANWSSVDYLNGKWVVISNGSTSALYSDDGGVTWQTASLPVSAQWIKVKHGANNFIAISTNNDKVAISVDGQTWLLRTIIGTAEWSDLAYGNNHIILIARNSNQIALSEDDGNTWDAAAAPSTDDWAHIIFANRKFVLFSGTGSTAYSSRLGLSWLEREYPLTNPSAAVAGLNKYLVLADNDAAVASDGTDNRVYRVLTVQVLSGSIGNYRLAIRVGPDFNRTTTPVHDSPVEIREKYSQVRLTGHDFLEIGTGNFTQTNYPTTNLINLAPENEVYYRGGGRVFYTSTDQDGNFRVGELFAVEQATGVVTISADYFDLGGLSELRLGGIRVGGTGVVIREFSTDVTFAADSNNVVPTQRAIKAYIERRISGGGSEAATGTLIAGTVRLGGPNNIGSTTNTYVNLPRNMNMRKGASGMMLAMSMFSDAFNSNLDGQEVGRDLG
jgi:hypothetical protein